MMRAWSGAAGLLLLAAALSGRAAELAVDPVVVVLDAQHDRRALQIENRGPQAVLLQVDARRWTQPDGTDLLEPTTQLVVNPPVFRIEPGRHQVVRVGLRALPELQAEGSFRLIVREVPVPAQAAEPAVHVLLELRLPVYLAPARPVRAQRWRAWTQGEGVQVEVENTGNVHQSFASLQALGDPRAPGGVPASGAAVLAGAAHRWSFPKSVIQAGRITIQAQTDAGPVRESIEIGQP
ncbi:MULTISPECIES: fimbria/pilus periplasmic chaperone [Ramlibacter]|uniref:Molecular chaperone n=1 Tax=Ramlibacter aquaticus TaxID=2780094 RepID=A0ABR9SHI0_9BURK|nr:MULTISPECIES: fimbria/pilus periplasmic chaperone [Ramlibacter]MBE7941815.1 molecular chaperone [Ramlibacter aquaticus]